jgi:hypothetical protein
MSIKSRQKEKDKSPLVLTGQDKTLTISHGPITTTTGPNPTSRKPEGDDAIMWAFTDGNGKMTKKYTMGQLKVDDPESYAIHSGQRDVLQADGSKIYTTHNHGQIVINEPELVKLIDRILAENNPNLLYEAEENKLFPVDSLRKAYRIID